MYYPTVLEARNLRVRHQHFWLLLRDVRGICLFSLTSDVCWQFLVLLGWWTHYSDLRLHVHFMFLCAPGSPFFKDISCCKLNAHPTPLCLILPSLIISAIFLQLQFLNCQFFGKNRVWYEIISLCHSFLCLTRASNKSVNAKINQLRASDTKILFV